MMTAARAITERFIDQLLSKSAAARRLGLLCTIAEATRSLFTAVVA